MELFHAVVGEGADVGADEGFDGGVGSEDAEQSREVGLDEFEEVGEGAVAAVLVEAEEPDVGGKEADGGFDEKVALLVDPFFVEGEEEGAGAFGGVGEVVEAGGVEGVAAVGGGEVVEVDGIEGGGFGESAFLLLEGVVGKAGEVVVFEVIDK